LADGLRSAGHDAVVLGETTPRVDALLQRRGFTPSLGHLPRAGVAIARGRFDVVHAFTAPDAALAAMMAGPRVVFTCVETLDRSNVADARLRLQLLQRAVERSDAVVVPGARERDAMRRWLAVEAEVLDPADVPGHERLYSDLVRG
jgi:hypothetical protein